MYGVGTPLRFEAFNRMRLEVLVQQSSVSINDLTVHDTYTVVHNNIINVVIVTYIHIVGCVNGCTNS